MSRLALFSALVAAVALLNACAAPTAPTIPNRAIRPAQDDTGAFCGWVVPNGRC